MAFRTTRITTKEGYKSLDKAFSLLRKGGYDIDLGIKTTTISVGTSLSYLNYLHYLPVSKRYKRAYINQYTRDTKITGWKGSGILFLVNESIEIKNLKNGTLNRHQIYTNNGINLLGSINPMYGVLFYTNDVVNATKYNWDKYQSKPNESRKIINKMNLSFEKWRKNMNGGF